MIELDVTFDLPVPPRRAFAVLADPLRDPQWQGACTEVEPLTGHGEVGSTYRYVMTMMGRRLEFRNTVVTRRPEEETAYEVLDGPVWFAGHHRLDDRGPDGTRVRWTFLLDRKDNFRMIPDTLVRKAIRAQAERDHRALAALLGRVPSGSAGAG